MTNYGSGYVLRPSSQDPDPAQETLARSILADFKQLSTPNRITVLEEAVRLLFAEMQLHQNRGPAELVLRLVISSQINLDISEELVRLGEEIRRELRERAAGATPEARAESPEEEFERQLDAVIEEYRPVLLALAEHDLSHS